LDIQTFFTNALDSLGLGRTLICFLISYEQPQVVAFTYIVLIDILIRPFGNWEDIELHFDRLALGIFTRTVGKPSHLHTFLFEMSVQLQA
jgi:hypothetical protein